MSMPLPILIAAITSNAPPADYGYSYAPPADYNYGYYYASPAEMARRSKIFWTGFGVVVLIVGIIAVVIYCSSKCVDATRAARARDQYYRRRQERVEENPRHGRTSTLTVVHNNEQQQQQQQQPHVVLEILESSKQRAPLSSYRGGEGHDGILSPNDLRLKSDVCSICLESFDDAEQNPVVLPRCAHMIHHHCIQQWLKINNTCPVCRTLL